VSRAALPPTLQLLRRASFIHPARYCFREESQAREFQRCRPHLSKIIEFQARVGYVKKISPANVCREQSLMRDSQLAPGISRHRAHLSSSAMELIYNYSHYMYGSLWVDDDAVDGEKGTVRL
jgi:hypothetical protein